VDVTIGERHRYWIAGMDDLTYNNLNCTMDFTITPR
jgi:hypothetical protein